MAEHPGRGILSGPIDGEWRRGKEYREVPAEVGLTVTHLGSRFTGRVAGFDQSAVVLRSPNTGLERLFSLHRGAFAIGRETVTLTRPAPAAAAPGGSARTASGSIAPKPAAARVARAGRIMVEGVHDAELVEKVWGDDLRVEGVVVEQLDGIDHLAAVVDRFGPGADARLGVLVDHLVPGSKESRIAADVQGPHVKVVGTPYVDVWQAIRPGVVGLAAWPVIPRDRSWKDGMCEALGEPVPGRLWKRLLAQVTSYADLEPSLVGAVESLIDFVTE
ncbi:MAG TPA: DUF3097 family protein [Acidimicrobiales bacterium]|jgi:hypothetical protein|nr:DUF3097 family protein [Acidimicrobiales bacterium]